MDIAPKLRMARIVLLTLAGVAVLILILVLLFIYSGRYNVAATAPHTAVGRWMLNTTQERSVRWHAEKSGIDVPAIGGQQLEHGIGHFVAMCTPCHGAPGVERSDYGKGMDPTPPDLASAARQWSQRELFWILKHGIRMTGMPAFGSTHTDDQLWGIVAFVQQLPNLSPMEYQRITSQNARREPESAEQHSNPPHEHP